MSGVSKVDVSMDVYLLKTFPSYSIMHFKRICVL